MRAKRHGERVGTGFVGKEGGERCEVECRTYLVTIHRRDGGLANGCEEGSALEELGWTCERK